MNCEQYRRQIEMGDTPSLAAHRQSCPECAEHASRLLRFETRVRETMKKVAIPEYGPSAVVGRLALNVKRKARRRAMEIFAVAASLFLAVGTGYVWRGWQISPPDDVAISQTNPGESFQAWAESLDFEFPIAKFNRNLYVSKGTVLVKPLLNLPTVTLVNPDSNATAQIYVVPLDKIDEAELLKLVPHTPLMKWWTFKDNHYPDRILYLMIYTGTSLDAFLSPPNDI